MNVPVSAMAKPAGSELVLTRDIAASRERLFAAWSDIKQASVWWAPRDSTLLSCEMDVRPERLVFTYVTENADGTIDPETLVSVSFTDIGGGKTRLTLWHTGFETEASRDGHRGGWTGGLERCAEFIETI